MFYYSGNAIMKLSYKNEKEETLYRTEKSLSAAYGVQRARKIGQPYRLIFLPTCEYISWIEITSVQVLEVMDPH